VLEGLSRPGIGHETTIREFAHVLDRGDETFNGTPKLKTRADYRTWVQIMSRHFFRLRKGDAVERNVLRMYGAMTEAEFFAVATESYFENPLRMNDLATDLYAELQAFYGGDPAGELEAEST
jgi:Mlc titration factor MtfA (ptsG expression regulator)